MFSLHLNVCTKYIIAKNPVLQTLIKVSLYPCKKYISLLGERASILDVGCGEGILSRLLREYFNSKVVGLDQDINRIQIAIRANRDTEIEFFYQDFLTFESNSKFDLIVFNDFLHHKSSLQQKLFLDRAISLLTDNGKILIKDIDNLRSLDYALTSRIDKINYPNDFLKFNSREEWESLFDSQALQIEKEFRSIGLMPSNNWNCILGKRNE
jgi:2-polyprenyl-3-methyl-5-hydroxy-6-metoxy-1,4-benzoquinol methylase